MSAVSIAGITKNKKSVTENKQESGNIEHGDGYADSNRPWTLIDPQHNKAKAIDYNKSGGKK